MRRRTRRTQAQIHAHIGHIRRSAVPPAQRRAQLGAYDSRRRGAAAPRPPQRPRVQPDGGTPQRLLSRMEPRERRGRSPLLLRLVAGRAAQQAQPIHVEEASCAHGHHQQHAHQSPVHRQQQPTCRGTLRFRSRPRERAAAGQRRGSARTPSCPSHAN